MLRRLFQTSPTSLYFSEELCYVLLDKVKQNFKLKKKKLKSEQKLKPDFKVNLLKLFKIFGLTQARAN